MKITILPEDFPGANYNDPCDCLLAKAIRRCHPTAWRRVCVNGAEIDNTFYYFGDHDSAALQAAHRDPSLLPLTITLNP